MVRILLVDDEEDIVRVFKVLLESNNYQVITAKNGIECLRKAAEEKPDLILLDIRMPNKDGFSTLRELKNNDSTINIPVVMLTVTRDTRSINECLNIGAKDYMLKTLPSEEFLKYIRRYAVTERAYGKAGPLSLNRVLSRNTQDDGVKKCWDFWKCEETDKNLCYVYRNGLGGSCWTIGIKKHADSCLLCSWFKKMHVSN